MQTLQHESLTWRRRKRKQASEEHARRERIAARKALAAVPSPEDLLAELEARLDAGDPGVTPADIIAARNAVRSKR